MTRDCCPEPNASYRYHCGTVPGIIVFCWRHLRFFAQCAGRVEELTKEKPSQPEG